MLFKNLLNKNKVITIETSILILLITPLFIFSTFNLKGGNIFGSMFADLSAIIVVVVFYSWRTTKFKKVVPILFVVILSEFVWIVIWTSIIVFDGKLNTDFWMTNIAGIAGGVILYTSLVCIILTFVLRKKYKFWSSPSQLDMRNLAFQLIYFFAVIFLKTISAFIRIKTSSQLWIATDILAVIMIAVVYITLKIPQLSTVSSYQ